MGRGKIQQYKSGAKRLRYNKIKILNYYEIIRGTVQKMGYDKVGTKNISNVKSQYLWRT